MERAEEGPGSAREVNQRVLSGFPLVGSGRTTITTSWW